MKKISITKTLVLLALLHFGGKALAAQDLASLKLNNELIEFAGTAPQGTAMDVMVIYSPEKSSAKSKACQFPEDRYSMNDSDLVKTVKGTVGADGTYSFQIPLGGIRKSCPYVFTNIYFSIQKNNISQSLKLDSTQVVQDYIALENELGGESTMEILNIEDQKNLYCDLQAEEIGLCYFNHSLPSVFYHLATSAHKVELNIKDISEQPERQY